jgi:hypothetical protein
MPAARLRGLALSELRTTRRATLLVLHGPGLTRVGQDAWLTSCEALDYPVTRRWGEALRTFAPRAAGFEWRPRHDNDRLACVFFNDRAEGLLEATGRSLSLEDGDGLALVRVVLRSHGVLVGRV